MPLYEYQCIECKQTVEVLQKVSDPHLSECSHCGGELERVLSVPSIRFKGSGWYVTDYADKNSNGGRSQRPSSASEEGSSAKNETPVEGRKEAASTSKATS